MPNELKGKARWYRTACQGAQHGAYVVNSQGKLFPVEYINHKWYWIGYTSEKHKLYTTPTRRIARPSILGLGTKEEPYLEELDQL